MQRLQATIERDGNVIWRARNVSSRTEALGQYGLEIEIYKALEKELRFASGADFDALETLMQEIQFAYEDGSELGTESSSGLWSWRFEELES